MSLVKITAHVEPQMKQHIVAKAAQRDDSVSNCARQILKRGLYAPRKNAVAIMIMLVLAIAAGFLAGLQA